MNSRERIRTVLDFKEPDRVPVDNNGNVSGIHEAAYINLLNYLNISEEICIYDYVQRLAEVKDGLDPNLKTGLRNWVRSLKVSRLCGRLQLL